MKDEKYRKALRKYEEAIAQAAAIRRAGISAAEQTYKDAQTEAKREFDRSQSRGY